MSICNLSMTTCNIIILTCNIIISACEITMMTRYLNYVACQHNYGECWHKEIACVEGRGISPYKHTKVIHKESFLIEIICCNNSYFISSSRTANRKRGSLSKAFTNTLIKKLKTVMLLLKMSISIYIIFTLRRKTLSNQSINQSMLVETYVKNHFKIHWKRFWLC